MAAGPSFSLEASLREFYPRYAWEQKDIVDMRSEWRWWLKFHNEQPGPLPKTIEGSVWVVCTDDRDVARASIQAVVETWLAASLEKVAVDEATGARITAAAARRRQYLEAVHPELPTEAVRTDLVDE